MRVAIKGVSILHGDRATLDREGNRDRPASLVVGIRTAGLACQLDRTLCRKVLRPVGVTISYSDVTF